MKLLAGVISSTLIDGVASFYVFFYLIEKTCDYAHDQTLKKSEKMDYYRKVKATLEKHGIVS